MHESERMLVEEVKTLLKQEAEQEYGEEANIDFNVTEGSNSILVSCVVEQDGETHRIERQISLLEG